MHTWMVCLILDSSHFWIGWAILKFALQHTKCMFNVFACSLLPTWIAFLIPACWYWNASSKMQNLWMNPINKEEQFPKHPPSNFKWKVNCWESFWDHVVKEQTVFPYDEVIETTCKSKSSMPNPQVEVCHGFKNNYWAAFFPTKSTLQCNRTVFLNNMHAVQWAQQFCNSMYNFMQIHNHFCIILHHLSKINIHEFIAIWKCFVKTLTTFSCCPFSHLKIIAKCIGCHVICIHLESHHNFDIQSNQVSATAIQFLCSKNGWAWIAALMIWYTVLLIWNMHVNCLSLKMGTGAN